MKLHTKGSTETWEQLHFLGRKIPGGREPQSLEGLVTVVTGENTRESPVTHLRDSDPFSCANSFCLCDGRPRRFVIMCV